MASNVFTRAVTEMSDGTYTWLSSTIKGMLVKSGYTPNVDHDFVSDGAGANELTVSGYTGGFAGAGRKTLASKTITTVDGSDRSEFSSAGLSWTALAAGETIEAVVLIFETGGADSAARVIAYCDVTDTPTNGGDVTINPGTGGWFYGTTV